MENCRKKERFICYEDNKTFQQEYNFSELLRKRIIDNDVDSDEEQLEASVNYLKSQLFNNNLQKP